MQFMTVLPILQMIFQITFWHLFNLGKPNMVNPNLFWNPNNEKSQTEYCAAFNKRET